MYRRLSVCCSTGNYILWCSSLRHHIRTFASGEMASTIYGRGASNTLHGTSGILLPARHSRSNPLPDRRRESSCQSKRCQTSWRCREDWRHRLQRSRRSAARFDELVHSIHVFLVQRRLLLASCLLTDNTERHGLQCGVRPRSYRASILSVVSDDDLIDVVRGQDVTEELDYHGA